MPVPASGSIQSSGLLVYGGKRCGESTMAERESTGEAEISRCRWSLVARPVLPTRAITAPLATLRPTFTSKSGVVVVGGVDPVALAVRADGRVMPDRDGQRALLGRPGVDHRAGSDRTDGSTIGIVELDSLMLLEVAAHGRAVAVRLIDVAVVGRARSDA